MSGGKPQWYFNSSPNPFTAGPSATWTAYSPQDNQLIEQNYINKAPKVDLTNHTIHFHEHMQVHKEDFNRQRPIKREPNK
jgi:hypothetical protein